MQPIYAGGYVMDQTTIDRFEEQALKLGRKPVDAIGKMAKVAGVRFVSVVTKAYTPHEGIIKAARRQQCGVIFMASRRGIARLIMGSVTHKVLPHSKIPVVVYR